MSNVQMKRGGARARPARTSITAAVVTVSSELMRWLAVTGAVIDNVEWAGNPPAETAIAQSAQGTSGVRPLSESGVVLLPAP
jgi:hypothetical protein